MRRRAGQLLGLRLGLTALAAALLAPACGQDDSDGSSALHSLDEIIATCSATSGPVEVRRRGEGFWGNAVVGSVFRPGDWLRAGAGAYARVEFLGSGALELDENATVILDQQEAPPAVDGGTSTGKMALVAVESGAVRGLMQAADGGTPHALGFATADGQRGRLEASEGQGPVEFSLTRRDKKTEVAVSSGEATLAFSGEKRTLKEGIAEEVDLGKLVEVVLLKPPALTAPRPEARVLFAASKPVPLRWEPVEGASGYRVQIARDPAFRSVVETREVDRTEYAFAAREATGYSWRIATRDTAGRLGPYSTGRRIHLEASAPSEHLIEPDPGSAYGYAGDPIRIAFRWRPEPGVSQYKVVIARSPDLERERVATETSRTDHAEIGGLTPGSYYWGVFAVESDGDARPMHLAARPLLVKRVSASTLRVTKKAPRWGD
ncbi:MAG TPA: hypothetical protein VFA20_29310 [Myxococcaceae bacterium]|nr:hypothetical protein [Myxococcaceae bacterium]